MLLIKGAHVVDPQVGLDTVTDVLVEGARIARVGANIKAPEGAEVIDGTGKYLVPGLTDIHVHFRDPGFEYKETIEGGVRSKHGGNDPADTPAASCMSVPSAPAPVARRARPWPRLAIWSPRAPACSPMTATACRAPACSVP